MQVASGVWRAESHNQVVYALDCGGAYVLVDVGDSEGLQAKLGQLASDGVELEKISAVLITHCHEDHAGALQSLKEMRPVRVVAHRLALEHFRRCPAYTPLDGSCVDYTVDEGDTVEIGELEFDVLHLPGHTPDSVAWQLGDSLFVGDVLRCDGGIGWMDVHWGSCLGDYRSSLQRLLRTDASQVYPGHGECGALTRDMIEQALSRLNTLAEADGKLLSSLGRPAPRRASEMPAKTVRLSTGVPATS